MSKLSFEDAVDDFSKRLKKHMQKNSIPPPDIINTDMKVHTYHEDELSIRTRSYWYIADFNSPAIALYGTLGGDEPYRWAPKRKDKDEKRYQKKRREMEKLAQDSKTEAKTYITDDWLTDDESSNANVESDEDAVDRLANLSLFDYDRCRILEAAKINIRPSVLDKAVALARSRRSGSSTSHEQLSLGFV